MNFCLRVCTSHQRLFTRQYQNFTYTTISSPPNCSLPHPRSKMRTGMKDKPTDKLSILQANDHFRDWHTLEDERVCALCNQKFSGNDVVISTIGDQVELRCPTSNCRSAVHQWVYPGNPLLSEKNYEGWWHSLGSNDDSDGAEDRASLQPI